MNKGFNDFGGDYNPSCLKVLFDAAVHFGPGLLFGLAVVLIVVYLLWR